MSLEFEGKQLLVQRLDEALDGDCARVITDRVRRCLCELMDQRALHLPDCVYECADDHYARRLIHRDADRGYTVLAMTWGPGQGTPVHDHAGMWCVEAVWNGQIEVVQYELMEHAGDRFRLEPRTTMRAGVGSAGSLIPPHEYHTIANPARDEVAVTIHIYSGEMERCCVFRPMEGTGVEGWYRREQRKLYLDAA